MKVILETAVPTKGTVIIDTTKVASLFCISSKRTAIVMDNTIGYNVELSLEDTANALGWHTTRPEVRTPDERAYEQTRST